jgi:hypothetical protein
MAGAASKPSDRYTTYTYSQQAKLPRCLTQPAPHGRAMLVVRATAHTAKLPGRTPTVSQQCL